MMRKKSFGKLAVVFALAALMLFGLCVCSKSSGSTASSTTAQTAATTTASTAAATTAAPAAETKVETPAATETKVETPVAETKVEEPVVEEKVEEPVVEEKVEEIAAETKVEEPVVEEKVEEIAAETKAEEPVTVDENLQVADDGTISGTYEYGDFASASFVMEGSKATIKYPAKYIYKEDIDTFMAECLAKYPSLSAVTYEVPEDGTLVISYPEEIVGGLASKLGILDTLNETITSYIDAYVETVIAAAKQVTPEAVEEVVETAVEEVSSAVSHVYADTLTYKGLSTSIVVDSTQATLTVPEGIEKDDIDVCAALVLAAYPDQASLVTYSFENGVLTLTYPEQNEEFLLSILDTLKEGGMYLIDLYGEVEEAVEEVAAEVDAAIETIDEVIETAEEIINGFEFAVEEDGTIRCTFNYRDSVYAAVTLEEDKCTVVYPTQYITKADIDTFMAEMVAEYGSYLENVYYDVPEEGTLVIYFDGDYVGGTYYRLNVLDELDKDVTAYIDELVAELEKEVEVVITEEAEASVAEESHVYADTLTYKGVTSTIVVDSTSASFTIPAGMTEEDLDAVVWFVNYMYPAEASLLTYSVDGGVITVSYPEQNDEFLRAALSVIRDEAMAIIDQLPAETETAVAEASVETAVEAAPAVEEEEAEAPVYAETLVYKDVASSVAVYTTYSTFTLPEGMSAADVAAVAEMVTAAYPAEASLLTYALDGDVLTVYYPEQNEDFLAAAVDVVRAEAMALIDSIEQAKAPVVKAEAEEAKVEAPVETAPVAAVEETKAEETAVAAVEETKAEEAVPAPVAPVVAPVVAEKAEKAKNFSVSLAATPKFNLSGKWDSPFVAGFGIRADYSFGAFAVGLKGQFDLSSYAQAAVYGKYAFVSNEKFDVYFLLGGGATFGLGANKGISGLVEAGLGFEYKIADSFSVFGEAAGQWSISNPGIEVGATVGAKIKF